MPEIRPAEPEDVAVLPEIERVAGLLFKTHPEDVGIPEELYGRTNSVETFAAAQQAGRLWVACGPRREPIGFALVLDIAGFAHLDELDVLPSHGRRGVGSALLAAVCAWADTAGYPAVTLRTFRDVPWNAPFYDRRGFQVVDSAALSPEHVRLEASERQRGLRTDRRVTMAYKTSRRQRGEEMTDASGQRVLDATLESWDRNNIVLLNLLGAIPSGGLEARAMAGSPTVSEMFTHMHHERMISVLENIPESAGEVPAQEWRPEPDPTRIAEMLRESASRVRDAVKGRIDAGLGLDRDFAHPIQLLHFLIFHEGYHHGQIKLALKAAGVPIADADAGPLTWDVFRAR